jgi:uncharacterized membrane protein YqhA
MYSKTALALLKLFLKWSSLAKAKTVWYMIIAGLYFLRGEGRGLRKKKKNERKIILVFKKSKKEPCLV